MRQLDQTLFDRLNTAALSADPSACKAAIKEAVADGVRADDIADFYIPAIARDMGERWCTDQMSFASVTIGASRLQAMLRTLGPNWSGDQVLDPRAPSILLMVQDDAHHTLGAIVLSGQLRRKGVSVKLLLGAKPGDVAEHLRRAIYHGIFISASRGERLEPLRQIIEVVKNSALAQCPVVIGGTILETETESNVKALTGADYATKVPDEALRFCGLLNPSNHLTILQNGN
ncbi:MAG: cobalamin B12-binding domain-containing protein [Pseudomonadota bacterium]